MRSQRGEIFPVVIVLIVLALIFAAIFVRFRLDNETTSGIAYNTTNDRFISGATQFSVRAGENTPTTEQNESIYCLPGDSPYKELVNRAAADKRVKITVTSSKFFAVKAPWICQDNVTVTEVK